MSEKLLPCPFCGGEAEFNDTSSTWVRCADCGAEIECQIERKDALLAWNRRALPALPKTGDDLIDALWAAYAKVARSPEEDPDGLVNLIALRDLVPSAIDVLVGKEDSEREKYAKVASAAVMKFRRKVDGKYYPGYHEDMRDAVRKAVKDA